MVPLCKPNLLEAHSLRCLPAGKADLRRQMARTTGRYDPATQAEVAELADAADSKSGSLQGRVGSIPTFGT